MILEILVPGVASLITFIMYWSYSFYHKPIESEKGNLLEKLKKEFLNEVEKYNKHKINESEFAKNLNNNIRFQNILENSGKLLDLNMFLSGIALIVISLIFSIIYQVSLFAALGISMYLAMFPIIVFFVGLSDLIKLRLMIESYKKGIALDKILPKRTRISVEKR